MLVKLRPYKVSFIFRNKKKSHGGISGKYGGCGMPRFCFWPKNYERATTKFSSFGMSFAATRFMPKTFEKKCYDTSQLIRQLHQQLLLL
jgi:hypothetical protein